MSDIESAAREMMKIVAVGTAVVAVMLMAAVAAIVFW